MGNESEKVLSAELPQAKSKKNQMKKWDKIFVVTMLAGPVIFFLYFWVYVNINAIVLAFQLPTGEWSFDIMEKAFRDIFMEKGSYIGTSLINTFLFYGAGLLMMPLQLFVAYFLYRRVWGGRFIQVVLYLPSIISAVALVAAFKGLLEPYPEGPIILLLREIGILDEYEIIMFLEDSRYARWTILFYTLWIGWGGNMLLLAGSLARIPVEVFEAGRLDGINTFQEVIIMVLPLLWPTVSTLLILSLTGLFGSSGPILLFTGSSSETYKTGTLAYWLYDKIKYGTGDAYNVVSATGLILTAIGMPVILTLRKVLENLSDVDY